jgi:crotonobetainyl-CoA:carnitine CoA-transferase CaiB-like acyl-CoA transferase
VTAGALHGIRILDLTRLLPGGLCTVVLGDLGADVLKVEMPGGGDYARARGPHHASTERSTSSASFIALNRNKRSVVLDLKDPDGVERFLALCEQADVVVESFRPGVLDRLGVGYPVMRERAPRIVHCAITGWGQGGPLAGRAGHDINYLASVGLLSMTGSVDEQPVLPPVQIADTGGALLAATAILAALRERDRSGVGQSIDVPLAHTALSLFAMGAAAALAGEPPQPRDRQLFSGGVVCYQAYRCADGWVALGALEERFWARWCRGVQRDDLLDLRYEPPGSPTHQEVAAIFIARTRDEWEAFAQMHDCCLTPVLGLHEALDADHVRERVVARVRQPGIADPVRVLGSPLGLSRTPPDVHRRPAPPLGGEPAPAEVAP